MSNQPDKSQKTEKPTFRRLKQAYEKGNVPRSQDVGQSVQLAVFLAWAFLGGGLLLTTLAAQMRTALLEVGTGRGPAFLQDRILDSGASALGALAPLLGALLVFAVAGQIAQTGFHPKKKPIEIDVKKMDPIKGLKSLFNVKKLFQAGKALFKLALYGGLIAVAMLPQWTSINALAFAEPPQIISDAAGRVGEILFRALALGILVAAVDFAFTKYRWVKDLYMSKKEVQDEQKENEGSPEIKGKIRGKQREMSRRRMMAEVKTADVVVTNPTHYAVALRYEREIMLAPVVVAKGKDHVAFRIRDEAKKNGVPVVEDPPLARALERLCPLGAPVPEALFRAVAEVFAFVFGKRGAFFTPHTEEEIDAMNAEVAS